MISVSNEFKTAMKQPVKELDAYILLDEDTKITSADDLIQIKVSCDTGMCKTAMRKLEAKYLGEHNLLGKWVHVGFGVKIADGTFEYLDFGSFLISKITTVKDTGVTTISGYDQMIKTMTSYNKLAVEYPIGLYDYTKKLCNTCGLTLGNESFMTHNDWQITKELWENISGITYRDILVQIAQVTGTTCIICSDNELYFKEIYDTEETLTYDNMKKLKLEPKYGEINSVVLSRTPAEDNIYMRDEESIKLNGLTELKIENNEIIDKDRDNAMTPIYEALQGISYYPFETTTEGLGWYEIADKVDAINDTGDVFNCVIFNFSITIDGGIKEILKATAETKTQTQYQYATTIAKRVKNAEIITDKIEGKIKLTAEEIKNMQNRISNTEITTENIKNAVKLIGGNNLQKNSIGAYGTADYDQSENGSVVATEEELLKSKTDNGFGRIMYLNSSKWIRLNSENLTIGETYTVSFKYSNTSDNQCTIKLQNNEEITLVDTTSENDLTKVVYTFTAFTENVKIFVSTADGTVGFTDYYLQNGDTATKWQPANGEVLSTALSIYYNGIEVTSENSEIITKISNLGFSVVNKVGKVLITFNKDKCILSDTEVDGRLEQNGWLRYVQKIDNNEALLEVKI